MMSSIEGHYNEATRTREFVVKLHDADLANITLDPLERMVVTGEISQPADILQSLEIVFRRMHEQNQARSA